MICSKCDQEVEEGAAFCGNCGQPLIAKDTPSKSPEVIPEYAVAKPIQHSGEIRSILSVIFGVIGIPASLIPAVGFGLGVIGLVLGTLSRRSHHKIASTIGIIASCLAILVSLGVWTYTMTHEKELSKIRNQASGELSAVTAKSEIDTPCYSLKFSFTLNTDHDKYDNCDVRVFEGSSIESSNNVYKIYGNKVLSITEANFADVAKQALENDIRSTLPGFTISGQRIAQFAGSPAYIINAEDKVNNIAVVEAAVFHKADSGYNMFSLVHATKGDKTDLKDLEEAWRWK